MFKVGDKWVSRSGSIFTVLSTTVPGERSIFATCDDERVLFFATGRKNLKYRSPHDLITPHHELGFRAVLVASPVFETLGQARAYAIEAQEAMGAKLGEDLLLVDTRVFHVEQGGAA